MIGYVSDDILKISWWPSLSTDCNQDRSMLEWYGHTVLYGPYERRGIK